MYPIDHEANILQSSTSVIVLSKPDNPNGVYVYTTKEYPRNADIVVRLPLNSLTTSQALELASLLNEAAYLCTMIPQFKQSLEGFNSITIVYIGDEPTMVHFQTVEE